IKKSDIVSQEANYPLSIDRVLICDSDLVVHLSRGNRSEYKLLIGLFPDYHGRDRSNKNQKKHSKI
ncbi:MAG: hypothetical protein V3R57_00220, partial [Candidatus Bathyarchaeia archaeon]